MTDMGHVYRSIKNGDNDEALNAVIASFIIDQKRTETVNEIRVKFYKQLREWALSNPSEMVLSLIRKHSGIDSQVTQGQNEIDVFVAEYISVLNRFPEA